jgi:hypothetical protein
VGSLLEHGDLMAHELEVIGSGQTRGASADDGNGFAGGRHTGRCRHLSCSVHRSSLHATDVNGGIQHGAAAAIFTGMLADQGAGHRERIVLADEPHRIGVSLLSHQGDVAGNIHMSRTFCHAGNAHFDLGGAASLLNMGDIVLIAALQAAEYHFGGFCTDGAVGGNGNGMSGGADHLEGFHGSTTLQNIIVKCSQLG